MDPTQVNGALKVLSFYPLCAALLTYVLEERHFKKTQTDRHREVYILDFFVKYLTVRSPGG